METGALGHLVGEEVGEIEEEVLCGGLEVDIEQLGGIASEGALLRRVAVTFRIGAVLVCGVAIVGEAGEEERMVEGFDDGLVYQLL